jgi:sugar lactone lactonase YvrE
VDSAGNVYVADAANSTIRKVTPTGVVTTRAGSCGESGSADGVGAAARFNAPYGIAVDSATNLYVADTFNHTIRKITPAQVVTTLAGQAGSPGSADGIGKGARFDFPSSIAVDLIGNLYVADTYNNTIRKLTLVGTNWVVTTLGGMAGFYGTADGAGSIARFSNPSGIAVDGGGSLYVADFYFNTIRRGYPPPNLIYAGFVEGHFKFNFTGAPGQSVIVEASTDLLSWVPIWTNSIMPDLIFSDRQSGVLTKRFYRARVVTD